MNLKENMQAIGDELSSEEKFFESALRTERFVKRYQKPLIFSVVSLIVLTVGVIGYQSYRAMKIESANQALNVLLLNPADTQAAQTLQSDNSKLYDLYQLSKALKEGDTKQLAALEQSSNPEVADFAAYESAVIANNTAKLNAYAKRQGALFQEIALILLAVDHLEKGNVAAAAQKLVLINEESSLYPVAQALSHYGVK